MKKGLILSGACILLLTGCSKKMTCTYESDGEDLVETTSKVVIVYNKKNEVVKKMTRLTTMELKDKDYAEKFADFAEDFKDEFADLKDELDKSYFSGSLKTSKKKIVLKEAYKFNKMTEDNFIDAGLGYYYDDEDKVIYLDEIKDDLEDSDYKCK